MNTKNIPFNTCIATDFMFENHIGELYLSRYISNNALALRMDVQDGPIAMCSVNVEGLAADELAIKDYSENKGMLAALIEQGVVLPPHRHVITGFEMTPVVRLAVQP